MVISTVALWMLDDKVDKEQGISIFYAHAHIFLYMNSEVKHIIYNMQAIQKYFFTQEAT